MYQGPMLWLERMMNVLAELIMDKVSIMYFLDQELTTDIKEGGTSVHLRLPNYSIPLPDVSFKTLLGYYYIT